MWDDEENYIGSDNGQNQQDGHEEGEADIEGNDDQISIDEQKKIEASDEEIDINDIGEEALALTSKDGDDSDGSVIQRRKKVKSTNAEKKSSMSSQTNKETLIQR